MKVLISAYACEPGTGSEPGVGWNIALQMARYHQVWVLTRSNNRSLIERELRQNPISNLHFIFYDLPRWARWWKKGPGCIQIYYYLWQIGLYFIAKRLHTVISFDLIHHLTFVKYWAPSLLSLLPAPFIWGPIGGGESTPPQLFKTFGLRGKFYEILRNIARQLGEHDPLVRLTVKKSVLVLATTEQTQNRLKLMGTGRCVILNQCGLSNHEIHYLGCIAIDPPSTPIRFVSIGRLLHWKGFHLALKALAEAKILDSELWIIGEGPEKMRLQRLAIKLGVVDRVKFCGALNRNETLKRLNECHVLVHPSLHDSGGGVCLEAMALGKPVICLNLGGPSLQVTSVTGFRIFPGSPQQVVRGISEAMCNLAIDPALRRCLGKAGQEKVSQQHTWERKGKVLNKYYTELA